MELRGSRLILLTSVLPRVVRALPLFAIRDDDSLDDGDLDPGSILVRGLVSAFLVLLGGVFAGLTIGLMGQDEVYLHVTAESGNENERHDAAKVLKLLSRGKHWVLVTLLLGNVITNETLPIVLDSILGGGWPAIVSSTAAIVVFGEIIPQSVCVRYGLSLGAFFSPFVLILMYIMYPVAVPIANLLDYCLGEDHGTIYKRAGLKSLVTLHHTMGVERLHSDEVTIISAVLDLKQKPVERIMTPIAKVFVLSSDTILDEAMVEKILLTGFNRIPIHAPNEPTNFVGMLLVRTLITYDPDDSLPISSFALATLPETDPETSCLNILNYFQEGKSHMVVVSTSPGDIQGCIGVVTLEDVIEELIGEEIVDESDVYVDVHKAIRRANPPLLRRQNNVSSATLAKLLPSNRASNPNKTQNAKITIKNPLVGSISPSNNNGMSLMGQNDSSRSSGANTGSVPRNIDNFSSPRLNPSPSDMNGLSGLNGHGKIQDMKGGEQLRVMPTETSTVHHNLVSENSKNFRANIAASETSTRARASQSNEHTGNNDEDEYRIGTFIENVVRVAGVNKVVIAEPSSPSSSNNSSSSSD